MSNPLPYLRIIAPAHLPVATGDVLAGNLLNLKAPAPRPAPVEA